MSSGVLVDELVICRIRRLIDVCRCMYFVEHRNRCCCDAVRASRIQDTTRAIAKMMSSVYQAEEAETNAHARLGRPARHEGREPVRHCQRLTTSCLRSDSVLTERNVLATEAQLARPRGTESCRHHQPRTEATYKESEAV